MTNHLLNTTSPYLLQHAENPVDWFPWGDEALEKARAEEKPILLSIGYSACHWCHVMAHESFENADIAAIMNEHFVNIKVDREQRPDLDKLYQTAHQLIARRSGGWPLTMFLTHDTHVPFFGGTYFPDTARYGMPAFAEVLKQAAKAYHEQHDEIVQHNVALVDVMQRIFAAPPPVASATLNDAPIDRAARDLADSFDPIFGGFGEAPKFPHASSLEFLLRYWTYRNDTSTLDRLLFTLSAMARGGIYDHVGGGFFRYSVDNRWEIPHFEKMLYDNGPLIELYATAWNIDGSAIFAKVATDSARWVMREMQSKEGGYYSALDADSEGEEGKFYAWTNEEVKALLGAADYPIVASYFGLDQPANFEGHWHLHATCSLEDLAERFKLDEADVLLALDRAVTALSYARQKRVRPGCDDKILPAWNGLMIRGMANAGRILGREDFIDSAERALRFAQTKLWDGKRLKASYRNNVAEFNAYLDDYAFLADGALALLQARFSLPTLNFAIALTDALLESFATGTGGFYFTSNDHEKLIQRPCQYNDDALPSGNAIAASVLLRLGCLLGNQHYLTAAEETLRSAWTHIKESPLGHCSSLIALCDYLATPEVIIIRGSGDALIEWQLATQRNYVANRWVLAIPAEQAELPEAMADKIRYTDSDATAYRCRGMQCNAPVTDLTTWLEQL